MLAAAFVNQDVLLAAFDLVLIVLSIDFCCLMSALVVEALLHSLLMILLPISMMM